MPLMEFDNECFTQIQLLPELSNSHYECTITFNPTLYTVASAYNDGLKLVESEILKWLEPTTVDYITFVVEYQKTHMVHYHLLISSPVLLPINLRANIIKGLQRIAGRSTFKPVINYDSYITYLEKDLELNYKKCNLSHLKTYYR